MPLIRPDVPRAVFDQSPLTYVVCQIQFEPILAIAQPTFIAAFQEEIRHDYPQLARVGSVEEQLYRELAAEEREHVALLTTELDRWKLGKPGLL